MTGGSKIIGMWRDRSDDAPTDVNELSEIDDAKTLSSGVEDEVSFAEIGEEAAVSEDDSWSHYGDVETQKASRSMPLIPAFFALLATTWTGFFLWTNRDIFTTVPTAQDGISLTTQWCLPIATLAVLYLLVMRNSSAEATRFNDVAQKLRNESDHLAARLKTVNNELSIAREFLASESRDLEFFADQSSGKLTTAAKLLKSSLSDGLENMAKLDDVSDSAYKNLEQLREHLPVVINTAKDVTNQIGNSGRSAQTEVAAMVATLKRVGDVGTAAAKSIDEMTSTSEKSLEQLSATAASISIDFAQKLSDADVGTQQIADILRQTTSETIEALDKARADLASETADSSQALAKDLETLETGLTAISNAAQDEEARIKILVDELNTNIVEMSNNVDLLDNESGEKTAKLAFAMTALEQNSAALQLSLEQGHGAADGMIERMENLLIALDTGARELDETLPAAFKRMDKQSILSGNALEKVTKQAQKANDTANQITENIKATDQGIADQREQLEKLQGDSIAANETMQDQISNISKSLVDIREQNEALAESSGEKLISALLRVKETAKQASEHSRSALENAISGSTETFEKVSEEALSRIIDEKIGSIAPKLETAVANAVATTQSTAGHLTEQLNAIEDMTTKLEQRILFAKEKAEQSSDENFTRRVALLTESLNSTAIDVTKLLSNEVTDTEWAAYLKGDRGIFTRRAVRLLDNGEVREILAEYDANSEFRGHVNRYIHDFEAMLRSVLATRDGSAISVTLLSSDIGKLYVALAQAIERLRN